MNPSSVLITGAAGFVGINLVRGLANHGFHVTAVARRPPDALAQAFLARVTPHVSWLLGDVTDPSWLASEALVSSTDHRHSLDLRRLEDSTGWRPRVPLRAGIAHTFEWHALGEDLDAIAEFAGGSP
jgi:nucleoside-diphosphate-sugar epimerase